jgi:hypothetical protein
VASAEGALKAESDRRYDALMLDNSPHGLASRDTHASSGLRAAAEYDSVPEHPQAEDQTILVARAEGQATINQAGRDINIGHEARDHKLVAGTVGLPTPPPAPSPPSGPAHGQGWSVAGQVSALT